MNSFRYLQRHLISAAIIGGVASAIASNAMAQALPPLPAGEGAAPAPVQALPAGATLDGARGKISSMSSEAGKSLEKLMGGAVTSRAATEVGAMAERKRSIMLLQLQRDEAKLAKELYFELAGDDESDEELARLREENEGLRLSLESAQNAPRNSMAVPVTPVVTAIVGAAGGLKATISYPGAGIIEASPGTVLPNGWKVDSVTSAGVTALDGVVRKKLGFGPGF